MAVDCKMDFTKKGYKLKKKKKKKMREGFWNLLLDLLSLCYQPPYLETEIQ